MPNTGKPSQDCHLCRQRRVKCDLQRPQCRRCIKYGAACPGYRNQQDLVFRHADAATLERRARRHDAHAQGHGHGLVLGRSLPEHWTAHSVPILLHIYDVDFVHAVFAAGGASTRGPLLWAAHLFSRTYMINMRGAACVATGARREAQTEVAECLGKALRLVSALLGTAEGAGRYDVIATVWILAGYELLAGTQGATAQRANSWHLHTRGLYGLLKSRGTAHLHTDGGRGTFWPAFTMILTECLVRVTPVPPESFEWLDVIEASLHPSEALGVAISRYIQVIAAAQHEALAILYRRDVAGAAAALPRLWAGMLAAQAALALVPEGGHGSDLYLVNLQRAATVKGFHIVHLLANFLTHYQESCGLLGEELLQKRAYCVLQVRRAARQILESVPSGLCPPGWSVDSLGGGGGDGKKTKTKTKTKTEKSKDDPAKLVIDALKIMWPLMSVATIPSCGREERMLARASLQWIGREVGVRQALGVREVLTLSEEHKQIPSEAEEPYLGAPETPESLM